MLYFFANQDLMQAEQNQNRQIQDAIAFLNIIKNYLYAKITYNQVSVGFGM